MARNGSHHHAGTDLRARCALLLARDLKSFDLKTFALQSPFVLLLTKHTVTPWISASSTDSWSNRTE
eukprot:6902878-Prymnesium_polylepis.1